MSNVSSKTATEFVMFIHSIVYPSSVNINDGFTTSFSFFTNNYATRVFCLCSFELVGFVIASQRRKYKSWDCSNGQAYQ
jgi:hypothetical protein